MSKNKEVQKCHENLKNKKSQSKIEKRLGIKIKTLYGFVIFGLILSSSVAAITYESFVGLNSPTWLLAFPTIILIVGIVVFNLIWPEENK